MENNKPKYFDDDGTEINPDLISKPDLCVSCKKDGQPGEEEILCNQTKADQQEDDEFHCEDNLRFQEPISY